MLTYTWKVTVKVGWERNFLTKDIILIFPLLTLHLCQNITAAYVTDDHKCIRLS